MSSSCFFSSVTPAADSLTAFSLPTASPPESSPLRCRTLSEPALNFALDLASLLPASIFPDAFLDSSFKDMPLLGKTLNDLTPEEFNQFALDIQGEIMHQSSGTLKSCENAYFTPTDCDIAIGAASGPIRTNQRSVPFLHLAQPYPVPQLRCEHEPSPPFHQSQPNTAGLTNDFNDLVHIFSPFPLTINENCQVTPNPLQNVETSAGAFACAWQGCTAKSFSSLAALSAHLLHCHVPRRRSHYPCLWRNCTRGGAQFPFTKRHKLIAHLRSHTNERPFVCPVCERAFAREDSRDAHVQVHGSERSGPWSCSCHGGRMWRSWRGVRRHQATGSCTGMIQLATGLPINVCQKRRRGKSMNSPTLIDSEEDDNSVSDGASMADKD